MSNGLRSWDTAFVYGMGASEDILAEMVKGVKREDVYISTKFTPQIAADVANPVEEMLDGSLKRLGTDYVDMYWVHNPHDVERWTPYLIPLVKSGKVKAMGVSNHNLSQIKRVMDILGEGGVALSAVQNHYSLLYRSSEKAGIINFCKENNIDFWAYMVLEQGAIGGRYNAEHPLPADSQRGQIYNPMFPQISRLVAVMREIGINHSVDPAQIAIAWTIAKGTHPIIGVTKLQQVKDTEKAVSVKLTPEEVQRLETVADGLDLDTRGAWENPMV